MRRPGRGTRPAIAKMPKIVQALDRATRNVLTPGNAFTRFDAGCRKIADEPMYPHAARSIGIIHDQSEAHCGGWKLPPLERRRQVFAIASVFDRDGGAIGESIAGQEHNKSVQSRLEQGKSGLNPKRR